jgi:hypothetical protein
MTKLDFLAGKSFVYEGDAYHFEGFDKPLYKENDTRNQNLILGELIEQKNAGGALFCDASFDQFAIVYHPLFESVKIPYADLKIIES